MLGGLFGGIASGISSIFSGNKQRKHEQNVNAQNIAFQQSQNKENQDFQMSMYDKQNADNIKFWNMQNAYNDPASQMQRLKDANLNPNLAYGNGSVANTSSSAIQTASAPTWQGEAPKVQKGQRGQEFQALANSLSNIYALEQQKANIAKTDAEKDAIQTNTFATNWNNQFLTESFADLTRHHKNSQLFNETKQFQHREQHDYLKALSMIREENNLKYLSGEMSVPWMKEHASKNLILKDKLQQFKNLKAIGDESTSRKLLNQIEQSLLNRGLNKTSSPFWKIGMDLKDFIKNQYDNEKKFGR